MGNTKKSLHNGSWNIQVKNFEKLRKNIEYIETSTEKAIEHTISDMSSRGPGWVAKAVTEVYTIPKSEIMPESKKSDKKKRMAGSIRVTGKTIKTFKLEYRGRLLTPTHFGMNPISPSYGAETRMRKRPDGQPRTDKGAAYKVKSQRYEVKQKVFKQGPAKLFGRYSNTRMPNGPYSGKSHNILMSRGTQDNSKIQYIPFQRIGDKVEKFTTLSLPQMITNKTVAKDIKTYFEKGLRERLNHHADRLHKKLGLD